MSEQTIRFDDGAAYEDFMGRWSRLAGAAFVDWLAPGPGLRWADIGCGNGAFTELLAERCAPARIEGIDPSAAQVEFARERLPGGVAQFRRGDAMALPYADDAFDAAVMALVLFFVPEPARGVAEMRRVVRPGGLVAAYTWDMFGSGFPYAVLHEEMTALGATPLWPPSAEASRLETMRALWNDAGLVDVQTREIAVQRTFDSFDAFWASAQQGPRIAPRLSELPGADLARLRDRLRARLPADARGRVTCSASANAIRGRRAA